MDAVTVSNLFKSYGAHKAVNGISFVVPEGSFFAFLGPNGAGKSTTISAICSLSGYDSGELKVFGKDPSDPETRRNVGVVFQNPKMDGLLTVRENIVLRGSLYGLDTDPEEAADICIRRTGCTEFADQRYGTLSGGQRRRADIARALVHDPRLLILDEPTTGLDPKTRASVWDLIKTLNKAGLTVMLTTHYMEEAAGADEILIINRGEAAARGTPAEIRDRYSSDRMVFTTSDPVSAAGVLNGAGATFSEENGSFTVPLRSTAESVPLISALGPLVSTLDVRSGTLDDAFLNIIGGMTE